MKRPVVKFVQKRSAYKGTKKIVYKEITSNYFQNEMTFFNQLRYFDGDSPSDDVERNLLTVSLIKEVKVHVSSINT